MPKVGERFYLHAYTGVIYPFTLNDSYKMSLLLPEGLQVDIRTPNDVQCAITDTSFNQVRLMGPSECQDPVRVGVYDEFPPVYLTEGEVANFFIPVVATRTFNQNAEIGLVADLMTNPAAVLPDPLYATNKKLVVDPAPAGVPQAPAPGGTGGSGGNGSPGSGSPGAEAPTQTATIALPAKLRGAKAVRATTPKVCKVTGKGKKTKVVKVKAGKCKLVGTKKGKKVKVTVRLR